MVSTKGVDRDPDGYLVTLNGSRIENIGANASLTFSDVTAGEQMIQLTGLASNCSAAGDNPRSVTVHAGGMVRTAFEVACTGSTGKTGTTGSISVRAFTSGVNLDPDGYLVTLNGSRSQNIGANAGVTFSDVTAGEQTVELSDLASNCSVRGDNPQSATVLAGATARIGFVITCTGSTGGTGSISVSASTTGVNLDPDGYTVSISGVGRSPIGPNATVVIPGLAPSDYQLRLSDLAPNCLWVPSINAVQVATVSAGSTAQVTFDVTCFSQPLGTLRVRASTTGPPPFFIYFVGIDGKEEGAVGVNGAADFQLSAGPHTVRLDAGPRCSGGTSRTVQVVSGITVETTFNVVCH